MKTKQLFKSLLIAMLLVLLPLLASAHSFKNGNLCYEITGSNTVSVTYQYTDDEDWCPAYNSLPSVVDIPSTVTYNNQTYTVTAIGDSAFFLCDNVTSVTIPCSVTSIGNCAFYICTELTSVTIPTSVTSIGDWAFVGCSGLESVDIESNNSVYDSRDNCNAIIHTSSNTLIFGCKNTIIPNSVTSIGDYAFYNCSNMTTLVIPSSVSFIGASAFNSCSGLNDIYCYIQDPSNVTLEYTNTFGYVPTSTCILHVPCGCAPAYQSAAQWSAFTNIVEMAPPVVLATSLTLSEIAAEVTEGETLQLTATVLTEEATDKTVTWGTSDATVATVDNNGLVTAVAPGVATITATTNDGSELSATCQLDVSATATNYLQAEDCTVLRGNGLTLPVQLVNVASNLTALQADIHLPDGITIEMDGDEYVIDLVSERVASDHALSNNLLPSSGAVRILIASPTKKLFKGNDGNGSIDVGDLVGVADIILSTESPAGMPAHMATVNGTANLDVICHRTGDGHYQVTVDMSNDIPVNAMQMDLALPQGLKLTDASLTHRASGSHAVDFNRLHNGDWRVLAASGSNKSFRDTEGAVLTLELEGDGEGLCTLSRIMLAQTNGARIVKLNETAVLVNDCETLQLTATVLPEDATDKTVTWDTSDAMVATVDNNGLVIAVRRRHCHHYRHHQRRHQPGHHLCTDRYTCP